MNRHEKCVDDWVKGMRTDKQRLDWLTSQSGAKILSYGTHWSLILSNEETFTGDSVRETIDKAMDEEYKK